MAHTTLKKDQWQLREILNLEELKKAFKHFSVVTGLDVSLFDFSGREVLVNRKENSFCDAAGNCMICRERVSYGGLMSSELGEPYISACGCGLIMCFLPIVFKERLTGTIACGPVLLWDADEVAKSEFLEKTGAMNISTDAEKIFSSISSCGCINMTSAAQILFILVNSLSQDHSVYLEQRSLITEQQAKIAELIIEKKAHSSSKSSGRDSAYPMERESDLLTFVKKGNLEQAQKNLDSLLGELFLFADGNMDNIRVRLFELIALFSRAAVETGAPLSELNHITEGSLEILSDASDFERLCFLTRTAMEEYITMVYRIREKKQLSDHLSKAVDFIRANYEDELTLQKVADAIFVSAFYLSHLFRNEMNTTFSDYVCRCRIEQAKEFLKNNRFMRIQEISGKTGFNDPNYFAKSFKKLVGVTPKEYRGFF